MLEIIKSVNSVVNNFIWGVPAMICIIGVGLLLSVRTKFLQIRKFPYAMKQTIGKIFDKKDASDGSHDSVPQSVRRWREPSEPEISPVLPEQSLSVVRVRYSGCGFPRCLVCVPSFPR